MATLSIRAILPFRRCLGHGGANTRTLPCLPKIPSFKGPCLNLRRYSIQQHVDEPRYPSTVTQAVIPLKARRNEAHLSGNEGSFGGGDFEMHLGTTGRSFSFFVVFSLGAFGAAAYATNSHTENAIRRTVDGWDPVDDVGFRLKRFREQITTTSVPFRDVERKGLAEDYTRNAKEWVDMLPKGEYLGDHLPIWTKIFKSSVEACLDVPRKIWYDKNDIERLGFIATWIFIPPMILWGEPALRAFAMKTMAHDPMAKKHYTTITALLSHRTLSSTLTSMILLTVLGVGVYGCLTVRMSEGRPIHLVESTTGYHTLAFLLSAGVFSTTISAAAYRTFGFKQLVNNLASPGRRGRLSLTRFMYHPAAPLWETSAATTVQERSIQLARKAERPVIIGASGMIYACATLLTLNADRLKEILPGKIKVFLGPLQNSLVGTIFVDVIGVFFGWRRFDHWSHIGGALFGALYSHYGIPFWQDMRMAMMDERRHWRLATAISLWETCLKGSPTPLELVETPLSRLIGSTSGSGDGAGAGKKETC